MMTPVNFFSSSVLDRDRVREIEMRLTILSILLSIVSALALGTPALAGPLESAAIQAAPQYYLMSLPRAPVGEIAEAVLGEALGLPYKIDEDIDAEMRFEVAGVYAPKALAEEFGYRLWNVDVALVETASGGLWLIPKAELAAARAQGSTLVAPLAAAAAPDRKQTPRTPPAAEKPARREASTGWSWLGWLIAGWVGGAVTLLGWQTLRRRTLLVTPRLAPPAPATAETAPEDLVIPVFVPQSDPGPQPNARAIRT